MFKEKGLSAPVLVILVVGTHASMFKSEKVTMNQYLPTYQCYPYINVTNIIDLSCLSQHINVPIVHIDIGHELPLHGGPMHQP